MGRMKKTRKEADGVVTYIVGRPLRDVCDIKRLDSRTRSKGGKQPITLCSWWRTRSHSLSHGQSRTSWQWVEAHFVRVSSLILFLNAWVERWSASNTRCQIILPMITVDISLVSQMAGISDTQVPWAKNFAFVKPGVII